MKEVVISFAEALSIGIKARRRHGRIAPAFMMIEYRRATGLNVVAGCLESIMIALFLNRSVVDRRWGRRVNDWLRMRAPRQKSGNTENRQT
jgi:hypothetical protein